MLDLTREEAAAIYDRLLGCFDFSAQKEHYNSGIDKLKAYIEQP
jgi:hypothetical protein